KLAVRRARVPIFFVQAENDFSTQPTLVLSAEADKAQKPHYAKIYPKNGEEARQGHALCVQRPDVWGQDVLGFLASSMR
ncbi:MAG TPA: hypothetical protein VHB21_21030, partial [Minicystis sp.]|nr:hypothetical protein [Minicystis sp.]